MKTHTQLPNIHAAHCFVCHCFGVSEKELNGALERVRKHTPDADKYFPAQFWRETFKRAENEDDPWNQAANIVRHESLFDHLRRTNGKPNFAQAAVIGEELLFSLLRLYQRLLPELNTEGTAIEEALWIVIENVFLPTIFINLNKVWRRGLGHEFAGANCWYFPLVVNGEPRKPLQRILRYWMRVMGCETAYDLAKKAGLPDAAFDSNKKKFQRWLNGERTPENITELHQLVEALQKEAQWLDEPENWKTRFTLASAMQRMCDEMESYFQKTIPKASLKIVEALTTIESEQIVHDRNDFLLDEGIYFANRLLQLRLRREGRWETEVLARMREPNGWHLGPEASAEEERRQREEIDRQLDPGTWLFQIIEQETQAQKELDWDTRLFNLGVAELNRLIKAKRVGE